MGNFTDNSDSGASKSYFFESDGDISDNNDELFSQFRLTSQASILSD